MSNHTLLLHFSDISKLYIVDLRFLIQTSRTLLHISFHFELITDDLWALDFICLRYFITFHHSYNFVQVFPRKLLLIEGMRNSCVILWKFFLTLCWNIANEATSFTEYRCLCFMTAFRFRMLNMIRFLLSRCCRHVFIDCLKLFSLLLFDVRNFIEFIPHMLTELNLS